MKKILLATTNKAKLAELTNYLSDLPFKFVSLKDLNFTAQYDEIGITFAQVAKNKARFYFNHTKIPVIADDGGLEIDALNGKPGVKSARWLGPNSTDQDLIAHTLKSLKNIPTKKRTAKLKVAICLFINPQKIYLSCKSAKGLIASKPSKNPIPGYPYRSLFWFPQFKKYYNDLTSYQHDIINHRKIALEKIRKILLNNYK